MPKKGQLEEWFSRILYGNEDQGRYSIVFRDFSDFIELSFHEFLIRKREDSIPLHRVSQIRKDGIPVYTRPDFCSSCGYRKPRHSSTCSFAVVGVNSE
ncbi:MAG: RNA repair domain-containing protein [Candidatus Thorarchaeota archaeon]